MTSVVSLEEAVLRREEIQAVRECLDKLSDRDRVVLLLKFSGHSYLEIAEVLNLNRTSVGTILARVQTKFARLWRERQQEVRE